MTTRKERRALAFGHMSPTRSQYQAPPNIGMFIQGDVYWVIKDEAENLYSWIQGLNFDIMFEEDREENSRLRDLRTKYRECLDQLHFEYSEILNGYYDYHFERSNPDPDYAFTINVTEKPYVSKLNFDIER